MSANIPQTLGQHPFLISYISYHFCQLQARLNGKSALDHGKETAGDEANAISASLFNQPRDPSRAVENRTSQVREKRGSDGGDLGERSLILLSFE